MSDTHPFFAAIGPLLERIGGDVVAPDELIDTDVPISWDGLVIGGVRLHHLTGALDRLVTHIEGELGGPLEALNRTDKQTAVRMLDQSGAFLLRKSIEEVADRMGVSRITIYNYLNTARDV